GKGHPMDDQKKNTPLGGSMVFWGTPQDIGRAVAFLSSDDADYITGSVLAVDGGFRYKDCRVENQKPLREE
ncbi:MAG TPA: SDR family oxidoreductase, partial [Planctomycetaceae bacterium]|nr:SDR family oxidoreductase [Planctomycetaceae bacterium]